MENLWTMVTLLIALSVASERLVEIVKGVVPWLNERKDDTKLEGQRKAVIQAMAVLSGILTAWLVRPVIVNIVPQPWQSTLGILAIGLLASGGSGFWNAIMTYLLKVKDIRKFYAEEKLEALVSRARNTA